MTATSPVDYLQAVPGSRGGESTPDSYERFRCTVTNRPAGGSNDHLRWFRPASEPPASRLLMDGHGFIRALSTIYGTDLRIHARRIVSIEHAVLSSAFLEDPEYRWATLHYLCQYILETAGFLVIHPSDRHITVPSHPGSRPQPGHLTACYLLGSCGFAQLCDGELSEPVPLFVRPWDPHRGLLKPRHVPAERFSRTLRVQRLQHDRMVLMQGQPG